MPKLSCESKTGISLIASNEQLNPAYSMNGVTLFIPTNFFRVSSFLNTCSLNTLGLINIAVYINTQHKKRATKKKHRLRLRINTQRQHPVLCFNHPKLCMHNYISTLPFSYKLNLFVPIVLQSHVPQAIHFPMHLNCK
jgi:hypothetical protein